MGKEQRDNRDMRKMAGEEELQRGQVEGLIKKEEWKETKQYWKKQAKGSSREAFIILSLQGQYKVQRPAAA